MWLWLGCMEKKCRASCWPWTAKGIWVVGFRWWNRMGTSDFNGSLQSTTKNQCKGGFSSSLFWQGRPIGSFLHAEAEAAILSSNTTGLWGSCEVDNSANGKIRDQEGGWLHWSSASGSKSLYLSLSLSIYIYIYSPAEIFKSKCIFNTLRYSIVQEIQPKGKKKSSPQRNALASALRLQRKVIRTLNESMDELNQRRKSLWWSRWIPREEWSS